MSLDYSANISESGEIFQSPPNNKSSNRPSDIQNDCMTSGEKQAARNFLSILSPARSSMHGDLRKTMQNSSLLSALFPNKQRQPSGDIHSPYRERSGSANEREFHDQLQQIKNEQGFTEEQLTQLKSNMILYKSVASIHSYRDYMKEKMRMARDGSNTKAKISTINTNYHPRQKSTGRGSVIKGSISQMSGQKKFMQRDSSADNIRINNKLRYPKAQEHDKIFSVETGSNFGSSKVFSSPGSNMRSQKIMEIEQILINNCQQKPRIGQKKMENAQTTSESPDKKIFNNQSNDTLGDEDVNIFSSPDKLMKELNQIQQDRASIFHSIEELQRKEREQQIQSSGYGEILDDLTSIDDLSRDMDNSKFQFNSPQPQKKVQSQVMKIEEIQPKQRQARKAILSKNTKTNINRQIQQRPKAQSKPRSQIFSPKSLKNQNQAQKSQIPVTKPKFIKKKTSTDQQDPKKVQSHLMSPTTTKNQRTVEIVISLEDKTPPASVISHNRSAAQETNFSSPQPKPQMYKRQNKSQQKQNTQFMGGSVIESQDPQLQSEIRSPTTLASQDQQRQSILNMQVSSSSQASLFRSPESKQFIQSQQQDNSTNYQSKISYINDGQKEQQISQIDEQAGPKVVYNNDISQMSNQQKLSQVKSSDNLFIIPERKKDPVVQELLEEYKRSKGYYGLENSDKFLQRGESPTKRLIQMKKAAHIHQPSVKQVRHSGQIENNYSIRYVNSPNKSYLVYPKEGEIDYSQAYRNFDKFFEKVSKQKIVKYRISEDMDRQLENKDDKWFKTPNKILIKETTRPLMKGCSTKGSKSASKQVSRKPTDQSVEQQL